RVLHRCLGHAVQWGLVQTNPAAQVTPPRVEETEVTILSTAQIQTVLERLRGSNAGDDVRALYAIVLTALGTGMRRGELCALRWQDLDLDAAVARVERSLEQTRKELRFKAPKTKHGRRSIALPAYLVAELRAHWKRQQETRLKLGMGKTP